MSDEIAATYSVIIRTAGDRPVLLRQAVASVLAQDVGNFEIVIVQDGDAGTGEELVRLAGGDPRLRHLVLPKQGRAGAAQAGLEAAHGAFACFLDDDDLLLPGHLSVLGRALTAHPEAPAVYSSWYSAPRSWKSEVLPASAAPGWTLNSAPAFSRPALLMANLFPIQAVLFRRAEALRCGGVDRALDALEDWDLWLRLSRAGRFIAVPQAQSVCRVDSTYSSQRDRERLHQAALDYLKEKYKATVFPVEGGEVDSSRAAMARRLETYFTTRDLLGALLRVIRRKLQ